MQINFSHCRCLADCHLGSQVAFFILRESDLLRKLREIISPENLELVVKILK